MENLLKSFQQNKNLRNPNIDLIRIAAMISIILNHLVYHGGAPNKYKYKEIYILTIPGMWHVGSFGAISGIVGTKTHKFSNLFYLWIVVMFYSIIIYINCKNLPNFKLNEDMQSNFHPVTSVKYWYFTAYFAIYPFLPFVNAGISLLTRIQVKKIIYFMIGIFSIWSLAYGDCFYQNRGHSPISLYIFYILGAYIGKYIFFEKLFVIHNIIICTLCIIVHIVTSIISFHINILNTYPNMSRKMKNILSVDINALPAILQIFTITIFISRIKINGYISKIITFIGPLTFDIYLIHENRYIRYSFIRNIFKNSKDNLNLASVFLLIFQKAFCVFTICIILAYIRSLIFKTLRIKKISIYFEIIATKILQFLL